MRDRHMLRSRQQLLERKGGGLRRRRAWGSQVSQRALALRQEQSGRRHGCWQRRNDGPASETSGLGNSVLQRLPGR